MGTSSPVLQPFQQRAWKQSRFAQWRAWQASMRLQQELGRCPRRLALVRQVTVYAEHMNTVCVALCLYMFSSIGLPMDGLI